jgi:hypothetical protein
VTPISIKGHRTVAPVAYRSGMSTLRNPESLPGRRSAALTPISTICRCCPIQSSRVLTAVLALIALAACSARPSAAPQPTGSSTPDVSSSALQPWLLQGTDLHGEFEAVETVTATVAPSVSPASCSKVVAPSVGLLARARAQADVTLSATDGTTLTHSVGVFDTVDTAREVVTRLESGAATCPTFTEKRYDVLRLDPRQPRPG